MQNFKATLIMLVSTVVVLGVLVYLYDRSAPTEPSKQATDQPKQVDIAQVDVVNRSSDLRAMQQGSKQLPAQTPERFNGKLSEVNTGCFADGECYVVIDGKHVTALWGWTQETVGTVKGVEGFGDLERYIGQNVSVYANKLADGSYTLYGNADYFIELTK